jgi:ABC-2 type transport system permease protein
MKAIWIITTKELKSYFDSLIAYVLLVLFLGFSGFFTWLYGNDIFLIGEASLNVFFSWSFWTLFFFIPGITMRSIAEEMHSGTIEIISTKAVSNFQIITGKFLAAWLLVVIALALTLPYYFTVSRLGNIDHGAVVGGYLGLLLISGTYISIGIFASSISRNQIIAFLLTLFIAIFFQLIFDLLSRNMTGGMAAFFNYISLNAHFGSISRGVIDFRDIFYFLSMIFSGLILANFMLSKKSLID